MLLVYDISLWFYKLGLRVASLFNPKAKQFIEGRKGIWRGIEKALQQENRSLIWMHCASLGEFEQGRPVLEKIRQQYPDYAILLTFFSPSGYEIRKHYEGADFVFYLPLDSKTNAKKFVQLTKPALVLFVKYEFWYHYLHQLQIRKVTTILFSAHFQKNQPFFKPYGGLYRKMLEAFQQIFVQDAQSKKLLAEIGKENVTVAGDTRFDQVAGILKTQKSYPNVRHFKQNKKLIVAGSTWPKDEELLKKVFNRLPSGQFKLLLAPHEVHAANIRRVMHLFEGDVTLWQAEENILEQKEVAIVDTVGHLSCLYQYADLAWVGGGFGKGIHNIIEPAVYGLPVFFGSNYQRFREAVDLLEAKAVKSVNTPDELLTKIRDESGLKRMGEKAKDYVQSQLGASEKIIDYLVLKWRSKRP